MTREPGAVRTPLLSRGPDSIERQCDTRSTVRPRASSSFSAHEYQSRPFSDGRGRHPVQESSAHTVRC
jgi:hypothetical protein